jgi:hypothetical protein
MINFGQEHVHQEIVKKWRVQSKKRSTAEGTEP